MAIHIDVIFTGLALFCLNEGSMCDEKNDVVYLMNAEAPDAQICGRQVDGGHKPVLSFESRHLLPGSAHSHQIVRTGRRTEYVVADLAGIDLCVCAEDPDTAGCPDPVHPGAEPMEEEIPDNRRKPVIPWKDERGFQWVPKLVDLHDDAADAELCPQVDKPFGTRAPYSPNDLVSARVHLDQGTVMTGYGWHDSWGWIVWRWLRRITETDFKKWDARGVPGDSTDLTQKHFPRALPGHATWRIPGIDDKDVVLINDCSDRKLQRTLFRLAPLGGNLRIYVNNGPSHKHSLAEGAPMEHFWWYYRVVRWPQRNGCTQNNMERSHCPDGLAFPYLPSKEKPAHKSPLKPILTVGDKCPPTSAG